MLKLTKTGIGLLTKQYRSVLRKCLLINLGAFLLFQENAFSELYYAVTDGNNNVVTLMRQRPNSWWSGVYDYHDVDSLLAGKADKSTTYTKTEVNNIQSLNYYYTFRVDERDEVIEFTKELKSNKKEMSSLDFMPIKSSSDLRINLIKAENPLTFSTKTRDDSLVLMEVCHA